MPVHRRRVTPPRRKHAPEHAGNRLSFFITALALLAFAYLGAATKAGSFLAEKVIQPVFRQMGVFAEKSPAQSEAPQGQTESVSCTVPGLTAYFLQSGVFASKENAETEAKKLQDQGGAGYVYQDQEDFRTIIAAYAQEKEAEAVKTRLSESMQTKVLPIQAAEKTVPVENKAQAEALSQATQALNRAIDSLYQANKQVDTAETCQQSLQTAETNLQKARETLQNAFTDENHSFASSLISLISQAETDTKAALEATDGARNAKAQLALCRLLGAYAQLIL